MFTPECVVCGSKKIKLVDVDACGHTREAYCSPLCKRWHEAWSSKGSQREGVIHLGNGKRRLIRKP